MGYGNDATRVNIAGSWFRKFRAGNFNQEDNSNFAATDISSTMAMISVIPLNISFIASLAQ